MTRRAVLLSCVLVPCSHAKAQSACPWLTSGSAAAALGAPVQVAFKPVLASEGACRFTAGQGAAAGVLEIVVSMAPLQQCPAESEQITGVGTGAVRCTKAEASGEMHFLIEGRVRSAWFRVDLQPATAHSTARDATKRGDVVEQTAEHIAEQVAGNLF